MLAEDTFQAINSPVAAGRQRASGLRFADVRAHSLWHAMILFRQLVEGFRAADLRRHLAGLSGTDPDKLSQGAITYQLRRLRLHGFIDRLPNSFRYRVTEFGFRASVLNARLQPTASSWTCCRPPSTTGHRLPAQSRIRQN